MKYIYRGLYCFIIVTIVSVPLLMTLLNFAGSIGWEQKIFNEPELSGVSEVPTKPSFSLVTLKSGEFQAGIEKYFDYNLATRKLNTRLYNQLLYSVFGSTDSTSVVVGLDKYLYEKAYPSAYLTEVPSTAIPTLTEKINKLSELKQLLNERGVALVVRISPTKAEHYPEYLPKAYSRFVRMKLQGEYGPNWYQVFSEEIRKTDIPVYDQYDLIEQMKRDGHIVFTKGGIHWSMHPMAEYINGLNELFEELLDKKLGRMIVTSETVISGQMGAPDDRDIWDICWNALYAKPNFPSPNVTLDSLPGEYAPKVFTVGQSFTTLLMYTIFHTVEQPIWGESYFSWYNSRVTRHSSNVPWGDPISEKTEDFEQYMSMDVILIEFLENTAYPDAVQFEFVENMLNYLKTKQE